MAKLGQYAWAIAHAKWLVWVKNYKCQKGAKNDCTTTFELLCAKKRSKKRLHSKYESILKMAKIDQYAWAMENGQFGSKIKTAKKVRKMIVRPH